MLMAALFEKALRLHSCAPSATAGSCTNLVSNDTQRLFECYQFLHYLWLSVTFVFTVVGFLYSIIGPAAFIGFFGLCLMVPLNAFSARSIGAHKRDMLVWMDARTNLISQILNGIQAVKAWGMEAAFAQRIEEMRAQEMHHLGRVNYLTALLRSALFCAPTLVSVITLVCAKWLGQPLSLSVVLETMAYLTVLRFPLLLIPRALALLMEARVSIRRIEAFLLQVRHA
jgi:ABC-type multidrug transport system fused ATPase/permease subunit